MIFPIRGLKDLENFLSEVVIAVDHSLFDDVAGELIKRQVYEVVFDGQKDEVPFLKRAIGHKMLHHVVSIQALA